MAYGLSIQSFIKVIDAKGKDADITFNHPLNVDLGALKNTLRSTAALIDALITGQVIDAGIILVVILSDALDLKADAIPESDVEEGVRFLWRAASNGETSFRIPTVTEDWLNSDGVLQVAPGDAVDDFVARVLAGVTVGLVNTSPSDAYGSDINLFLGGTESFLASRG